MDFLSSKLKNRKTKSRLGKTGAILLSSSLVLNLAVFAMSAATAYASSNVPPIVSGWVQVSTPGQLEYIDSNQGSYLNAHIELMNNIDLTGYNWIPFGTSTPFSGTFNGQGYQITNVVGNTGGFFGTSIGTIENVGVGATITNGSYSNNGILVNVQNGGTIINSHATGSVSGNVGGNIGGLVGYQNAGSIIKSYSTASVLSRNGGNDSAGGLVGVAAGSISYSYATGSVSGDSKNGGLVGYLGGNSTISNSYATGLVSGGHNGGLAGYYASGTISSSYFDTTATGTTVGFGSGGSTSGVTGETTANMKSQSTFAGWDFTSTWGISSGQNGGYPYLQVQTPTATVKYSTNSWTNQDVTATIVPSTAVSVTNNNGSLSHTFSENGSFTFNFVDEAGSKGSVTATVSNIDKTAPTTTDNAPTGWVNKDATVTLTSTDSGSGVANTYYILDGGAGQTGTTVNITTEGIHSLTYWSVDKAGNVEAKHTATVRIDTTAPTITGAPTVAANANGWYNGDVTVHFSCSDSGSGVASCTQDTTVNTEGTNQSVQGTAADNAGNSATTTVSGINIDKTAPVTTDDAPTNWVNKDVTVTLTSSDSGSGVDATYYTVDGGAGQTGTTVTITAEGTHTLMYWSVDKAGNVEAKHTATVRIDKTAPTVNVVLDKNTLWPPNHKLVPITASVNATDSLSGVNSIVLTSITSNEPDNGLGDGDQPNDIQGAEFGTFDTSFMIRAERAGNGKGRIYTITYTVTDNAGNKTNASATVLVPHDQSGKK